MVGTGESNIEEPQGINPGFSWVYQKKKPRSIYWIPSWHQGSVTFGNPLLGLYSQPILKSTYKDLHSKMFITALLISATFRTNGYIDVSSICQNTAVIKNVLK